MHENIKIKKHLSSFQIIIIGFAAVILLGSFILMMPFSAKNGSFTPFNEALFTATSAVCVTGLIVKDTASHWSVFGQSIILILIQIGGLGVVTVAASVTLISGRKISLSQRTTMQEAIAAPKTGGIVRLTGFIIKTVFVIEFIGAILLMPIFCKDFGLKGIWMSFFHSISAFCNAGFDIMGTTDAQFVSLTPYADNILINIVIMLLIVIGGIGFLTWDDVRENKIHFKRYRMQSKVCLIVTLILIILPATYFFFFEFNELGISDRILYSLFQSVTPRTAGFNTADFSLLSGAGQCIIIILMLIGGSPGSTAGGMKTTTLAVLFANAVAVFRRKEDAHFFGRRIDDNAVNSAATLLIMYIMLFVSGAFVISIVEGLPFAICMFETASAVGTAGLTLGITSGLGIVSQIILIILMFLGRVGGLTLIYATLSNKNVNVSRLPQEKIIVG